VAWAEKLPSGRYRGMFRDALGRRRSAGTFTHKPRAERAAAAREEQARRSIFADSEAYRRPWGEWCDEWWPTREVEASTEIVDAGRRRVHLDPRWATVPVGAIRRHDVKEWAASMRRAGVGPGTVQHAVHLLSASLNAAVDNEIIESNPASRIKLPGSAQAQERYLTLEEYAAVVEELPTSYDQLLVEMLAYTGLRWGEVAGLHWNRVDLGRGLVRVVETYDERSGVIKAYPKSRRLRSVPLTRRLVTQLAEVDRTSECGLQHKVGVCRSGLVFTSDEGNVVRNSNWSSRVWRPAVERAAIGHCRIHDLRHTYASWLLQAGRPLAEVGQLLGHVSPATTQRYAHLAEAPYDAVLAALESGVAAPRLPHVDEVGARDVEVQGL